ncbi:hypothetical protein A1O1_01116 [Capronia coronata CBS 617.96]|uniref:Uncharacterized protein n=1 Tax=Capronia coronata CBS 617.96 TaxID=1182541 RepID=W9Z221_9EURO|nr:uncharacterized protein A1O1_01116 [Capronia coronata CBS 617.96]EXJ95990.1 hypothetical protein A1O1_01116 [Capronia coronata CBS 617.96]
MLLSSRATPPQPLKLAGPERYLSIKSLLPSTPIPSPSLPSILPRHGKKPPKLNSRRFVRALLWLSLLIGVYYLATSGKKVDPHSTDSAVLTSLGNVYEGGEALELPDRPTPLALMDGKGKRHWTVWIPPSRGFPLPSSEYADLCSQAENVAGHVAGRRRSSQKSQQQDYMRHDPNYLDVDEAQARHFLPTGAEKKNVDSTATPQQTSLPVCNSTLTYVLDATDAGLGSALLGIWLSYGLAERENRSFFIDDSNFPYGNYSTFFIPPTPPPCRPPVPSHRVPCPHQAKHVVVSAATTTKWTFGESFRRQYSQREIFAMARTGYEALFKLRKDDDDYVRTRTMKLRTGTLTKTNPSAAVGDRDGEGEGDRQENGLLGIHIRRGDRHPYEFAYQLGYLPPDRYLSMARKLVGQSERWKLILASDDAEMYDNLDLPDTVRAQQRISLASKKSLGSGLGWEGGFFKDVFWSLGLPAGAPTKAETSYSRESLPQSSTQQVDGSGGRDYRTDPTKEALRLRELLGRAYLLDLAVLAQSDKVVCGVSSHACRILAVMLGWERAFQNNDWTNVDGDYGWKALD